MGIASMAASKSSEEMEIGEDGLVGGGGRGRTGGAYLSWKDGVWRYGGRMLLRRGGLGGSLRCR